MSRRPLRRLATAAALAALIAPAAAAAAHRSGSPAAPPPLSADRQRVDTASGYGDGAFGHWHSDRFGLPAYRYTIDELTAPQAVQPELAGSRDGWSQVGNDRVVADAFNHGYVQLWSQDRDYQWLNHYDAGHQHFAGGFGYLNIAGRVVSTLYDDRPHRARTARDFGVGYFHTRTATRGVDVSQVVYAPFGNDPLLLHDVTIRNTSRRTLRASWFEYWDVNPYAPGAHAYHALSAPAYDAKTRTLSVAQQPSGTDTAPLSIFASAVHAPVAGYDTTTTAFFGSGSRARPAAVAADHTSNSLAAPTTAGEGSDLFAFRSPVSVPPGATATLRYAYGYAHPDGIAPLAARYTGAADPYRASERAWARWLPQISFGDRYPWLSRELQWDAYMVRSDATYEECARRHILSQGGYYQYGFGFQGAFRDPLQHMLPMVYADPRLARDVLLYSAAEQPARVGAVPYARIQFCQRLDLGTSDDLDLWLLWSTAEYVTATRDFAVLDRRVPYANGGTGTLWDHLKLAYTHQEQVIGHGPHGGYVTGATGDWADFSTEFLQMTESMLPVAQAAYIYPLLAGVADRYGDRRFAAQLRRSGTADLATLRRQWTGRGWYSRGYSGDRQLGAGAIFGEPQGWAMLAGAPSRRQAATLVRNIRRFLDGVGAPAAVHGPARIGSSVTPAANDPAVTERSTPSGGVGDNNSNFVGGVWFAVNGWLTWGLAELDGVVAHAVGDAWSEFLRNTLAVHAHVYPKAWDGVLSVDDTCWAFYSSHPDECGNGLNSSYDTQIMHQPAWSLFDAVKLAGVQPQPDGYRIDPHLPMRVFTLRLPGVGVAYDEHRARGYLRPVAGGRLVLRVHLPRGVTARCVTTWAGGRRVAHATSAGWVSFAMVTRPKVAGDWAVSWGCRR